jgi:methionine aminopeptidase
MQSKSIIQLLGSFHQECQRAIKQDLLSKHDTPLNTCTMAGYIETYILTNLPQRMKEYDMDSAKIPYGLAFPATICRNEVVAHKAPSLQEKDIIDLEKDLLKIDFGFHVDGYIVDQAFSYAHPSNELGQLLIQISQEATDMGIQMIRPDQSIFAIGEAIQECIEQYETPMGEPIKSIYDVCGHSIARYQLHAGQCIPNVRLPHTVRNSMKHSMTRIQSGLSYAVETFPTNGSGSLYEDRESKGTSCYMFDSLHLQKPPASLLKTNEGAWLWNTYRTYAFSPRQLFKACVDPTSPVGWKPVIDLVQKCTQCWKPYPPLIACPTSSAKGKEPLLVAQVERNVYVDPVSETTIVYNE